MIAENILILIDRCDMDRIIVLRIILYECINEVSIQVLMLCI